MIKMANYVT